MLAMSSSVHCVSSPWHRATRKRVSRSRVGCRSSSGFRGGASSSATSHAHEEKEAEDYRAHLYDSVDLWSTSRRASLPGGGAELDPETFEKACARIERTALTPPLPGLEPRRRPEQAGFAFEEAAE